MGDLVQWLLLNYGQEQMVPGLERIKLPLARLLPVLRSSTIVTIAGTNGKGETTLRLSQLLKNESHLVWTSPHILRLTERFRDEKGEISEAELRALIQQCHEEVRLLSVKLTFYEFLFYVFCSWASEKKPTYLLLEVGLGGRLDAVNALDADLVLLPSISRDHQEYLGSRFDLILGEKLGTLREKTILIHYLESQYLQERSSVLAKGIGAKTIALQDLYPLPGFDFSRRNSVLAYAAYCHLKNLPFAPENAQAPFLPLEHRGEVKKGENDYFFFGSHNVDGVRKLIQFLHSGTYNFPRPPYDAVVAAFSRRNPSDLRSMLKMLKQGKLGKVAVTTFDHPKASDREFMEALTQAEGIEFVQDIGAYLEQQKDKRILVTGSYYFLGHFKSLSGCR